MKIYFSPTTRGFFSPDIHGAPFVGDTTERNPATLIPADAVEITPAEHQTLLQAQAAGQEIQADQDGRPIAVDRPAPTAAALLKAEILALELTVSQRRIREALLGVDDGWLAALNGQIAGLRAQLA